jgi:zinc resistance-associated protein
MWKALVVGTTLLAIAGPTLAYAQHPSQREQGQQSQRPRLSAADTAAFTDARIAAFKTALKLTPDQEKNWPAVAQAIRDVSTDRFARREARRNAAPHANAIERLRNRADSLTTRGAELKRLADAEQPLYQSLDDAQKHRFDILLRFAARQHRAAAQMRG